MDIVPNGEEPTARRVPLARIRYDAQVRALREAAQEWGVRSSTPEGAVISALIGSIGELGDLSFSIGDDFAEIVETAQRVAQLHMRASELEVEKVQLSLSASAAVLDRARVALANVDIAREHLAKKVAIDMSADILRELKPHLGAAVVIRQRHQNWRAYGFASLAALGFVVVGIVFGVWASAGPSLAEASIALCASAPTLDGNGHAWCDLSHLPHFPPRPQ